MPKKWEDCVNDVKRKGGSVNPYAVCTASTGLTRSGKRSKSKIEHHKRGTAMHEMDKRTKRGPRPMGSGY